MSKYDSFKKGKGKTYCLFSSTPGTIEDWQAIIDQLSVNYKVTAYDRYGNGFSTANHYNYTPNERKNYNQALTSNSVAYSTITQKITFLVGEHDAPCKIRPF